MVVFLSFCRLFASSSGGCVHNYLIYCDAVWVPVCNCAVCLFAILSFFSEQYVVCFVSLVDWFALFTFSLFLFFVEVDCGHV